MNSSGLFLSSGYFIIGQAERREEIASFCSFDSTHICIRLLEHVFEICKLLFLKVNLIPLSTFNTL